jgi:hypothetical protein
MLVQLEPNSNRIANKDFMLNPPLPGLFIDEEKIVTRCERKTSRVGRWHGRLRCNSLAGTGATVRVFRRAANVVLLLFKIGKSAKQFADTRRVPFLA